VRSRGGVWHLRDGRSLDGVLRRGARAALEAGLGNEAGLARRVARLRPVGVLKGRAALGDLIRAVPAKGCHLA
jgi:hypothetical protein